MLLQDLGLHIVVRGREAPLLLADGADLALQLLSDLPDLGDHLVDRLLEILLGDELMGHDSVEALGLVARRGWWVVDGSG